MSVCSAGACVCTIRYCVADGFCPGEPQSYENALFLPPESTGIQNHIKVFNNKHPFRKELIGNNHFLGREYLGLSLEVLEVIMLWISPYNRYSMLDKVGAGASFVAARRQ